MNAYMRVIESKERLRRTETLSHFDQLQINQDEIQNP